MVETPRTGIPAVDIWVMCVIMAFLTGFLVAAPLVANGAQEREARRYRAALGTGTAPAGAVPGAWASGSTADGPASVVAAGVPGPRSGDEAVQPTRADLPAQRSGDGDEAALSPAAGDTADVIEHDPEL